MANKEAALEKYTLAKQAIDSHLAANKPVFDAHQKLVMTLMDADNELRDAVAESGSGVSNPEFTVTVTPQTQEVWDEDLTLGALGINKEEGIRRGLIKINERPPRISISENK